MTTVDQAAFQERLEEEALILLRAGGFDVADGSTQGMFAETIAATPSNVDPILLASKIMHAVVFAIRTRKAFLLDKRAQQTRADRCNTFEGESELLEERLVGLQSMGFTRAQTRALVQAVAARASEEMLRGGEGRP